ncbi:hypothetical protein T440DRAFT_470888 [Plenodomus tracheiphilus IPT5]|uniref:Uncharacterized protein n=1 Tax=Plenodomus tracheiphilus IPT5 TaxID=1408161 RepID=A0A6A7AZM2_9PLEO|nr:hypothetical protein T440DRAFT_470888 [Plenodomus tracheiphilus IPT5]
MTMGRGAPWGRELWLSKEGSGTSDAHNYGCGSPLRLSVSWFALSVVLEIGGAFEVHVAMPVMIIRRNQGRWWSLNKRLLVPTLPTSRLVLQKLEQSRQGQLLRRCRSVDICAAEDASHICVSSTRGAIGQPLRYCNPAESSAAQSNNGGAC